MKKYFLMFMLAAFVTGCGQADQAKKDSMSKPTAATAAKSQTLIAEGMNYLNDQDVVNAIKSFDDAIRVDPQNSDNYMVLGQVYLRLRNYDKATDTFNAGTRIDPSNGELFYFLGAANAVRHAMEPEGETKDYYKEEAILAAKKSIEIFIAKKDEEKFKRAVLLLKSLEEGGDATAETAQN